MNNTPVLPLHQILEFTEHRMNVLHDLALKGEEPTAGDLAPLFILGEPGTGKTSSIRSLTEKLNLQWEAQGSKFRCGYRGLHLTHINELDLVGLPYVKEGKSERIQMDMLGMSACNTPAERTKLIKEINDREDKLAGRAYNKTTERTAYAANSMLPDGDKEGEIGILVLDELCSAQRAARAAVLPLLDETRAIHEYHLPKYWICIGSGNGEDDGGIYEGFEGVVTNRGLAVKVDSKQSYESWKVWAHENGIHEAVLAYLAMTEGANMYTRDANNTSELSYASPRSWTHLSDSLKRAEEHTGGAKIAEAGIQESVLKAYVGLQVGAEFFAFYHFDGEVDKPEDILAGKVKVTGDRIRRESFFLSAEGCISSLRKSIKGIKVTAEQEMELVNFTCWLGDVSNAHALGEAVSVMAEVLSNLPAIALIMTGKGFKDKSPKHKKAFEIVTGFGNKLSRGTKK